MSTQEDEHHLRHHFSSFFAVTATLNPSMTPQDVRRFFALVYNVSVAISAFLLQKPEARDLAEYCVEMKRYMVRTSPIDAQQIKITELGRLLHRTLVRYYAQFAPLYEVLHTCEHEELVSELSVHARMLVHPILCAMITNREHCGTFHALKVTPMAVFRTHLWTRVSPLGFSHSP